MCFKFGLVFLLIQVAAKRRLLYEELDKNFIPTLKAVIAEKVRLEGWSQEKARRKFLE